jgi:hypothetical protein
MGYCRGASTAPPSVEADAPTELKCQKMRIAALAFAYAAAFVAIEALLATDTHLLDLDWVPEGPAEGGWLGAASFGLLAGAAVMIGRKPPIAGLLASLSAFAYAVATWNDNDFPMLVWTVAFGGLIYLAGRLDVERRNTAKRTAIHQRIDELLVETFPNA